ncbi:MAG: wax ester/triacylglycerol synthase family O-acyltransferase [Rubrivivax sp.]
MQQLSDLEAGWLAGDDAHANANVSLVHIHDQGTAPGGVVRFKAILAHIESRLGALPLFRRRLQRVPFGVDRPYWVDDEHFDLEYHVRHIALPKPGDWRQFCIQVSRIHARPLDLNRPLWEIYVIEGLDSFLELPEGSFALLTKTHPAAFDPEHDGTLAALLHDLQPQAQDGPPAPWFPLSPPRPLPLLARGVVRNLMHPRRLAAPLARRLRQLTPGSLALAGESLLHAGETPLVRFNAVVSPHRVFESRRFALDEVERIRALVDGADIDDVVLAVCAGALRRYLDAHEERPVASLLALLPQGARTLATDVDDPLERLRRIHAGAHAVPTGPPPAADGLLRRAVRSLAPARAPAVACRIVPLPAPDLSEGPRYLCGARLSYVSAMLPVGDGMGLAIAVTRLEGRLILSPTSCRQLLPDPERFAQALRDSFQELLALAAAPAPRRRRARTAKA